MKKLLFLCVVIGHALQAQSVDHHTISVAGGLSNNSNNFLQFTIGESAVGLIGTNPSIDQGFWATFSLQNTLSINNFQEEMEIISYPNPVSDKLTIRLKNAFPYRLSIYNILNQKVLEKNQTAGFSNSEIELSQLRTGNYLIILSNPDLQINKTIKIIKY